MTKDNLKVLIVAAEAVPFAKVGGLGDVVGALSSALKRRQIDVRLIIPYYGFIDLKDFTTRSFSRTVQLGSSQFDCAFVETVHQDVPVYLIKHDELFNRDQVYGPPGGAYPDNCLRFSLLSHAAIECCHALNWWPDVFHAHDWQAALLPVLLNTQQKNTASILTIHNLAHQGQFPVTELTHTHLQQSQAAQLGMIQNDGGFNLLRGGINHATLLTTVSPTYAKEIQTHRFGEGLDMILHARRDDLVGILNGIDRAVWDPSTDTLLPKTYTAKRLSGKAYCKASLQRKAGLLQDSKIPLLGLVSRLVHQKGIDLVMDIAERLIDMNSQLVILGQGDPRHEQFFHELSKRHPDKVHVWTVFDESIAHLIEAGSDMFLMPSRYEPCGLNQMYSQLYGSLPVVRATGGLADTVENFDEATGKGTGFSFHDGTPEALMGTLTWAIDIYRNKPTAFKAMVKRAMSLNYEWDNPADSYEYVYRLAAAKRAHI